MTFFPEYLANFGLFLFFSSFFLSFLRVFVCGRDCPFESWEENIYHPPPHLLSSTLSFCWHRHPIQHHHAQMGNIFFIPRSLPFPAQKRGATPKNNRHNKIMEPNDFVGISGVSSVLAAKSVGFPLLSVNCFFFPLFFRGGNNGPVVYTGWKREKTFFWLEIMQERLMNRVFLSSGARENEVWAELGWWPIAHFPPQRKKSRAKNCFCSFSFVFSGGNWGVLRWPRLQIKKYPTKDTSIYVHDTCLLPFCSEGKGGMPQKKGSVGVSGKNTVGGAKTYTK